MQRELDGTLFRRVWTREITASGDQPPDGFTISAETEDPMRAGGTRCANSQR